MADTQSSPSCARQLPDDRGSPLGSTAQAEEAHTAEGSVVEGLGATSTLLEECRLGRWLVARKELLRPDETVHLGGTCLGSLVEGTDDPIAIGSDAGLVVLLVLQGSFVSILIRNLVVPLRR